MYVCLCHGYRDSQLRELARKGVSTALEAYKILGDGPSCGRCLECAQDIIDKTKGSSATEAAAGQSS